jgi:hypothetical protein
MEQTNLKRLLTEASEAIHMNERLSLVVLVGEADEAVATI